MKSGIKLFVLFPILIQLVAPLYAVEKVPQKVIEMANQTFRQWSSNPIVIKAVIEENIRNKTLQQIKEIDKKWQSTPGIDDFMAKLMKNDCGKYLTQLKKQYSYIAEIFVMDNQGANVAMSDKTSDYWQGDETKFIKSFNNGQGGLDISEVKFDDSSQVYVVQVSIPVKDGRKVIGAMTIGIDIEKID